jgi:hypothetical protein
LVFLAYLALEFLLLKLPLNKLLLLKLQEPLSLGPKPLINLALNVFFDAYVIRLLLIVARSLFGRLDEAALAGLCPRYFDFCLRSAVARL